ncbi:MAG TPA: ParA family protein [Acetobacteraceae bacterium]|jgi:chromosome partitioning protein
MMEVTALVSQKGGSGKTTLALHLAVEAARRGERVLLVDLDPQASATKWADRRQASPVDIDVSSEQPARLDTVLKAAEAGGYTSVILDTAPNADQAALRAARSANVVLIPCRPSILDLDAIGATLEVCTLARIDASVVLNAAPVRSRVSVEARAAIERTGGVVCPVVVHERVAFRHALVDGRVASEYEPDGAAGAEITALYDLVRSWMQTAGTSVQSPKQASARVMKHASEVA